MPTKINNRLIIGLWLNSFRYYVMRILPPQGSNLREIQTSSYASECQNILLVTFENYISSMICRVEKGKFFSNDILNFIKKKLYYITSLFIEIIDIDNAVTHTTIETTRHTQILFIGLLFIGAGNSNT